MNGQTPAPVLNPITLAPQGFVRMNVGSIIQSGATATDVIIGTGDAGQGILYMTDGTLDPVADFTAGVPNTINETVMVGAISRVMTTGYVTCPPGANLYPTNANLGAFDGTKDNNIRARYYSRAKTQSYTTTPPTSGTNTGWNFTANLHFETGVGMANNSSWAFESISLSSTEPTDLAVLINRDGGNSNDVDIFAFTDCHLTWDL
jgi:hypothetical protein